MATVLDIARFIIDECGPMPAMKLQKLVYYGQAWSLGLRDKRLFDDEAQAWAYGPVVRTLFLQHRGKYAVTEMPQGDATRLSPDERRLLSAVVSHYGALSGEELSDMTHAEAPWKAARSDVPAGERSSSVITHSAMKRFYSPARCPFNLP